MREYLDKFGITVDWALGTGALVVIFTIVLTLAAKAHDWYPHECCHQQDCAPATHVEVVPTQSLVAAGMIFGPPLKLPSQLVITTKWGKVIVPENFGTEKGQTWRRRPSPDGQWHACIQTFTGKPTLICLFDPSGI